jgi:hypothetical protein
VREETGEPSSGARIEWRRASMRSQHGALNRGSGWRRYRRIEDGAPLAP